MKFRKQWIGNQCYSVQTPEEFNENPNTESGEALAVNIDVDDRNYTLPIINRENVNCPGIYPPEGNSPFMRVVPPEDDISEYDGDRLIDYSSSESYEDILEKNREYVSQSDIIVATGGDKPDYWAVGEDDTNAMRALKEALNDKEIEFDLYRHRFPPTNVNNIRRKLNDKDITLKMMKEVARATDMKITLTIEDARDDVPNPIGRKISYEITDSGEEN